MWTPAGEQFGARIHHQVLIWVLANVLYEAVQQLGRIRIGFCQGPNCTNTLGTPDRNAFWEQFLKLIDSFAGSLVEQVAEPDIVFPRGPFDSLKEEWRELVQRGLLAEQIDQ